MFVRQVRRGIAWVILGLGSASLGGCPQTWGEYSVEALPSAKAISAQTAIAPRPITDGGAISVPYETCQEIPDWVRPSEAQQRAQLASDPRYTGALEEEPLKSLSEKFWTENIITFTTYGLSARMEPINFTGLWTVMDDLWVCYEGDRPEAINQGTLGEIWLIDHRLVEMSWSGSEYLLTVEPTGQGVQLIQFERQETEMTLPPVVALTAQGTETVAVSGDW